MPKFLEIKFISPSCVDLIERASLNRMVREQEYKRLVLINADAGFGKTSLLAQIYEQFSGIPVWYQFDKRDNDLAVFFEHLIEGTRRLLPGIGAASMRQLAESKDVRYEKEYILTVFVNEILDAAPDMLAFFFDDFQVINDNELITESIQFLLNNLSEREQIYISSRKRPNLAMARLRVQRQLFEIDADQLRFTREETEELLSENGHTVLDDAEIDEWYKRTEGWPLALTLVSRLLGSGHRSHSEIFKSLLNHSGPVAEFLTEEVWNHLDDKLKELFLVSCLIEPVDIQIVDQVQSTPLSAFSTAKLFKKAADQNFLTVCLKKGEVYRFHQVFREYLIEKLGQIKHPDDIADIHGRYAEIFKKNGKYSNSIEHYFKAGKPREAAEIIGICGYETLVTGKRHTLERWLKKLPEKEKWGNADLLYLSAEIAEQKGDMDTGLSLFETAGEKYRKNDNRQGLYRCAMGRSSCYMSMEECGKGLKAAEEAVNWADEINEKVCAIRRVASLLLLLGNPAEAMRLWEEVYEIKEIEAWSTDDQIDTFEMSVMFFMGKFRLMLSNLEGLLQDEQKPLNIADRFLKAFYLAIILFEMCRYEEAMEIIYRSDSFIGSMSREQKRALEYLGGCIRLYMGEVAEGREVIDRIEAECGERKHLGPDRGYNHIGMLERQRKRYKAALEIHEKVYSEVCQKEGRIYTTATSLVEIGADKSRIIGESGSKELEEALTIAQKSDYEYIESRVYFHRAWLSLQLSDTEAALEDITRCLEISSSNGYIHFLVQEGQISMDLLAFAYENAVQREFLTEIFGLIGSDMLEHLVPMLRSNSAHIREAAVYAVAAAGGLSAAPYLFKLLKDNNEKVYKTTKEVLTKIREKIHNLSEILTKREIEVLELIATGISNAEIAKKLYITEPTVKTHITRIFQKLGVNKRTQAATFYLKIQSTNI